MKIAQKIIQEQGSHLDTKIKLGKLDDMEKEHLQQKLADSDIDSMIKNGYLYVPKESEKKAKSIASKF